MNNTIFSIFTFLVILGTSNLSAQYRTANQRGDNANSEVNRAEAERIVAGEQLSNSTSSRDRSAMLEARDNFLRADAELTRRRREAERLNRRRN